MKIIRIASVVLVLSAFSVFALGKHLNRVHRRMLQSLKIGH